MMLHCIHPVSVQILTVDSGERMCVCDVLIFISPTEAGSSSGAGTVSNPYVIVHLQESKEHKDGNHLLLWRLFLYLYD